MTAEGGAFFVLNPFTDKDGDTLGEGLRGLSVETASEFEGVCAQSFASFTN